MPHGFFSLVIAQRQTPRERAEHLLSTGRAHRNSCSRTENRILIVLRPSQPTIITSFSSGPHSFSFNRLSCPPHPLLASNQSTLLRENMWRNLFFLFRPMLDSLSSLPNGSPGRRLNFSAYCSVTWYPWTDASLQSFCVNWNALLRD